MPALGPAHRRHPHAGQPPLRPAGEAGLSARGPPLDRDADPHLPSPDAVGCETLAGAEGLPAARLSPLGSRDDDVAALFRTPGATGQAKRVMVTHGSLLANARATLPLAGLEPELTAEALRGGFRQTGDAGYLDADGGLHMAGRTRETILTGGENLYPTETERALPKGPAVAESAVLGLPDPHRGERAHAVASLKPGSRADPAELIAFRRAYVAGCKCPRSVAISEAPPPLTSANKIDKLAIRRQLDAAAQSLSP